MKGCKILLFNLLMNAFFKILIRCFIISRRLGSEAYNIFLQDSSFQFVNEYICQGFCKHRLASPE